MCKLVVKKLSFVIRYVPHQYKTQQICNKAISENGAKFDSASYTTNINKCVIKLLIITLMHQKLSPIAI